MSSTVKLRLLSSLFLALTMIAAWAFDGSAVVKIDDVPLIPRQTLFGSPDRAAVRLSPDGSYISFLSPKDGVMNIWVAPIDDLDAARPVTDDRLRGITNYQWSYLDDTIIYLQDTGGDENWVLYSVNVSTGENRRLTPGEGVRANLVATSYERPHEIVIGLNDRVPQYFDLYLLNIVTGERELIYENEGLTGFLLDEQFNLRFGIMPTPDGGMTMLAATEDGWEPRVVVSLEDAMTTGPITLTRDGQILYLIDSRGRNTAAIIELNLESGEEKVIFENPKADASHGIFHPQSLKIQAAASTYDRREWEVLDQEIEEDLGILESVADGELELVSRTWDDDLWIAAYIVDDGPVRYYLYDRQSKEAAFLFTNQSALDEYALSPMHSVFIEARDGQELVGYLTLPLWETPEEGITPSHPLPMVLQVHGGPWARDGWGFNSLHQWLANRGYAVLSVNFRGSLGFGKDFLNAGAREWGGLMQDDLIDAVNWAVDQEIADPDKVCISGGSYGGYAALAGLTFTPDFFACGISVVGPSNLITLLESLPPYWEPQIEMFTSRVGDHRTEEGRAFLKERSPLTYADRIQRPLLIGQGANDPRVKQAESDQIVEAMQQAGIPVTYVLYPDEGHGFVRPPNRISFYAVQEAFLHEHLGGRYQPVDDDFKGSSIQVPAGITEIPGLKDALQAEELNAAG